MANTYKNIHYFVLKFLLLFVSELEATICYTGRYLINFSITYCRYGCCGPSDDQTCCPFPIEILVGCLIGGAVLIAIIVTVICCCRRRGNNGRIIQTSSGVSVVVQTGMTNTTCVTPMYPLSGGQAVAPPPSYAMPPPSYSEVTGGKSPGVAYDNAAYT